MNDETRRGGARLARRPWVPEACETLVQSLATEIAARDERATAMRDTVCAELDASWAGRRVELEFDSERRDKYGRTLAYVRADGEFVNGRMVAEGLARARFYGEDRKRVV